MLSLLTVNNPERFKNFLGVNKVDGYGCTKSFEKIVPPEVGFYRYGSGGLPLPVQEVRFVDENDHDVPVSEIGEIVSRRPLFMKAYWRKPKETAEAIRNGWFYTGDLVKKVADGFD